MKKSTEQNSSPPEAVKSSRLVSPPDGEYVALIRESSTFGKWFDLDLEGIIIILYRANHGWRTPDEWGLYVHLPHQVYITRIDPLAKYPNREIVAVSLQTAKWQTIWAYNKDEISYPKPSMMRSG